jgi:hypothetical protein
LIAQIVESPAAMNMITAAYVSHPLRLRSIFRPFVADRAAPGAAPFTREDDRAAGRLDAISRLRRRS